MIAEDPARQATATVPPVDLEPVDIVSVDPFREIGRAIAVHQESIVALRALAHGSRNDAIRLGATKAAASTAASLLDLLTRVGMLPADPATWVTELRWEAGWRVVAEALTEAGARDAFVDALGARHHAGTRIELTGLGPRINEAAVSIPSRPSRRPSPGVRYGAGIDIWAMLGRGFALEDARTAVDAAEPGTEAEAALRELAGLLVARLNREPGGPERVLGELVKTSDEQTLRTLVTVLERKQP